MHGSGPRVYGLMPRLPTQADEEIVGEMDMLDAILKLLHFPFPAKLAPPPILAVQILNLALYPSMTT